MKRLHWFFIEKTVNIQSFNIYIPNVTNNTKILNQDTTFILTL